MADLRHHWKGILVDQTITLPVPPVVVIDERHGKQPVQFVSHGGQRMNVVLDLPAGIAGPAVVVDRIHPQNVPAVVPGAQIPAGCGIGAAALVADQAHVRVAVGAPVAVPGGNALACGSAVQRHRAAVDGGVIVAGGAVDGGEVSGVEIGHAPGHVHVNGVIAVGIHASVAVERPVPGGQRAGKGARSRREHPGESAGGGGQGSGKRARSAAEDAGEGAVGACHTSISIDFEILISGDQTVEINLRGQNGHRFRRLVNGADDPVPGHPGGNLNGVLGNTALRPPQAQHQGVRVLRSHVPVGKGFAILHHYPANLRHAGHGEGGVQAQGQIGKSGCAVVFHFDRSQPDPLPVCGDRAGAAQVPAHAGGDRIARVVELCIIEPAGKDLAVRRDHLAVFDIKGQPQARAAGGVCKQIRREFQNGKAVSRRGPVLVQEKTVHEGPGLFRVQRIVPPGVGLVMV